MHQHPVGRGQGALRGLVQACVAAGVPAPAASAALSHYDGLRSVRLPANLIQAQRQLEANVAVIRTGDELLDEAIDILA